MLWGAIKEDGTRILVRCPERLKKVLRKGFLPMYESHDIFQQDNAPCHKSRAVSSFVDNYGICCISDWPPQPPDLNIVEDHRKGREENSE